MPFAGFSDCVKRRSEPQLMPKVGAWLFLTALPSFPITSANCRTVPCTAATPSACSTTLISELGTGFRSLAWMPPWLVGLKL